MTRIFIVIAAYNEARAIEAVVQGLRKEGYPDIAVVDDGSRDNTAELAENAGATVIVHSINRGQGAALKTGIDYALQQGADIVVTFDADGQHRVEDIPAMVKPVLAKEVDGSRFIKQGSNVPWLRKQFLKAGALLFKMLYGVTLTDSHNGFRALSRKAAEAIKIETDRMEHASEIIDQIGKHKLRYREIPVIIKYTDYSKAHSSQGRFAAMRIFLKTLAHKFLK
jgi:polyprenyl-phospho-N-acetylgalactosaminyl synthase